LQGLTDKVYEFKDKKIKMHIGDIYEFLDSRNIGHLNELNRIQVGLAPALKATARVAPTIPTAEQERQKKKEQERDQRRRQNQIEKLEAEIDLLEKKKIEMDKLLSNPANITNSQVFVDYNRLKEKIDKAMHEWEKLQSTH
jgi:ATP-binding cassette subfamily F protein 3